MMTSPLPGGHQCPYYYGPRRMHVLAMMITMILSSSCQIATAQVRPRVCRGAIRHVHISVGPDPASSMIVSFASISSRFPAPVASVQWGTSPTQLDQVSTERPDDDSPTFYNLTAVGRTNGNYGADYYSPYYHHVRLTQLQPKTTYYYKPILQSTPQLRHYQQEWEQSLNGGFLQQNSNGDTEADDNDYDDEEEDDYQDETDDDRRRRRQLENTEHKKWRRLILRAYDPSSRDCPDPDKIHSFTTGPVVGPDSSIRLAIVGDLGQFPHSEETVSRMQKDRHAMDLILLAGDVAYSKLDHLQWDTFFDFLDDYPLVDHVPLQVCPGNHDIDMVPHRKEIFLAYEQRFRMPRVHPPQLGWYTGHETRLNMDHAPYPLPYEWGNSYYSFSYGPARIIMMNAYASMEPDSTQYVWLVKELQAVRRDITPWVIVVLHTPIYNTFAVHQKDLQILAARQHVEPVLVQYRVNWVLTGHIHAYLRTHPVTMQVVNRTGPVHVTVGAGGRKAEAPFRSLIPEPWVATRDAVLFGYGMLQLHNATHATWDYIHTGGHSDEYLYNRVGAGGKRVLNVTLPPGPARDVFVLENQYYL